MSSVHFGLGIYNLSHEIIGQTISVSKPTWFQTSASSLVAMLPILLVFSYVQWTYYNGTPSFTAPLELIGALLTPVLAGIFPVLLLIASRKQAGHATQATVGAAASHPLLLIAIVILSFAGLLSYGFVLWENPWSQACALFVTTTMLVLILDQGRRGLFMAPSVGAVVKGQWVSSPVSKV
jgi:hypothetical protein